MTHISNLSIWIFSAAAVLCEAGLLNYFLLKTCELREKSVVSKAVLICSAFMEAAAIFFMSFSGYFLIPILLILLVFLYTNILYMNSLRRNLHALLMLTVYFLLDFLVDFMFSVIYRGSSFEDEALSTRTQLNRFSVLSVHVLSLFTVILIMLKVINKSKEKGFILSLTVPVVALLSMMSFTTLMLNTFASDFTLLSAGVLFVSFILLTALSFALVYRQRKEGKLKIREALIGQREEYARQSLKDAEAVYNKNRTLRHDLKNQNLALLSLLSKGEIAKAKEIILENEKSVDSAREIYSKNETLDLILNLKIGKLKELSSDVKVEIMTSLDFVKDGDLSVIFGNLLDNVCDYYETHEKAEKLVSVKVFEAQGNVLIEIGNRIEASVLSENPQLLSTKSDNETHGLGLASVNSKVKIYNGDMNIHEEKEMFTVTIIIPKAES